MPKRSSKHTGPEDVNEIAFRVFQETIGEHVPVEDGTSSIPEKNPAAVTLGRMGGLKGGRARADKLDATRKSDIARKAAEARWKNHHTDKP